MDVQSSNMKKPLRVMKFGGTSLGDPTCIRKVVEIVCDAARDSRLIVVVSAMSGVTNRLIEAAKHSEAGNRDAVRAIFENLRERHNAVVSTLIHSIPRRNRINRELKEIQEEGERLCQGTTCLRELTSRANDSISSLGERLSAPLVAAALAECGVDAEAISAMELVVTDSSHGCADPLMEHTRERCASRLLPLLRRGVVPVITGFIGATLAGVLTTLGRGGSDYSATILGEALEADEVVIWTDVNGLMTADPRSVPDATTIAEISHREAAELAHFGAKVLHPKSLRPVTRCAIPLSIRNTFAPERPGTRVTPTGPSKDGVKGLTAMSDVALVTVSGLGMIGAPEVLSHTFATTAAVRAGLLLISQSSSQNDICLVIPSSAAERLVQALRGEFAHDPAHEKAMHITFDPNVAMITVVGKHMRGSDAVGRTFAALDRKNINIVAIAQGSSESNISFVVPKMDAKAALNAVHQEFDLGAPHSRTIPVGSVAVSPAAWQYEPAQRTANAD